LTNLEEGWGMEKASMTTFCKIIGNWLLETALVPKCHVLVWNPSVIFFQRADLLSTAGLALKQQLLLPDSIVPMTTGDWKVDLVIASP
jgi:hypothetical protein